MVTMMEVVSKIIDTLQWEPRIDALETKVGNHEHRLKSIEEVAKCLPGLVTAHEVSKEQVEFMNKLLYWQLSLTAGLIITVIGAAIAIASRF